MWWTGRNWQGGQIVSAKVLVPRIHELYVVCLALYYSVTGIVYMYS